MVVQIFLNADTSENEGIQGMDSDGAILLYKIKRYGRSGRDIVGTSDADE